VFIQSERAVRGLWTEFAAARRCLWDIPWKSDRSAMESLKDDEVRGGNLDALDFPFCNSRIGCLDVSTCELDFFRRCKGLVGEIRGRRGLCSFFSIESIKIRG
jgi:hypothetical protein